MKPRERRGKRFFAQAGGFPPGKKKKTKIKPYFVNRTEWILGRAGEKEQVFCRRRGGKKSTKLADTYPHSGNGRTLTPAGGKKDASASFPSAFGGKGKEKFHCAFLGAEGRITIWCWTTGGEEKTTDASDERRFVLFTTMYYSPYR